VKFILDTNIISEIRKGERAHPNVANWVARTPVKMLETEPRAASAHYDKVTGRVTIDLVNGCAYVFPARLVEDLHGASDESLVDVRVDGVGFNLHWPALDVDLYVPALVSGIFGSRKWMASELARIAGRSRSPAKAAARSNGARGSHPRKVASG
jgi:hypothetical protein